MPALDSRGNHAYSRILAVIRSANGDYRFLYLTDPHHPESRQERHWQRPD